MLIKDMDLARLMIHVQQVKENKLKDREKFKYKRAKTSGNEFRHQKIDATRKGPAPPSAGAPAPKNKCEYNSQNSHSFKAKHVHS